MYTGWLLPVVGTEAGNCIVGRDVAALCLSLGVTISIFDYIRKTPVVGFKEDSPTVGRRFLFVGLRL